MIRHEVILKAGEPGTCFRVPGVITKMFVSVEATPLASGLETVELHTISDMNNTRWKIYSDDSVIDGYPSWIIDHGWGDEFRAVPSDNAVDCKVVIECRTDQEVGDLLMSYRNPLEH